MGRLSRRAAAAVLLGVGVLLVQLPANAQSVSGTILLPCSTPTPTRLGVTPQGVCGWKFAVSALTHGATFTLTPAPSASDLDIYFYASDAACNAGTGATCPRAFFGCNLGSLSGVVPSDAAYAIVVFSDASVQLSCPTIVRAETSLNVSFTYTA